jgi:sulfonate transport system permease protein
VFFGFGLGAVSATLIGSLTGFSSSARAYLDPFLQAIRNIPSMAWVPVFILWFGIAETGKIALVALGGFFPVYLNLMEGIRSVDRKLIEAAWVCGFRGYRLFYSIYFRSTLACYMVGLRQGLALAWMFVVAAEIMGSSCGLGYLLVDGESTGRLATLIVSFILFAICGKFTDALLVLASDHILYWRDITSKN